jgi:hypothetical protein
MKKDSVELHEKIDGILRKLAVILFIILISTQWYLKNFNKGIEPFLNKLYNNDGLSFKVIEIVPQRTNNNK